MADPLNLALAGIILQAATLVHQIYGNRGEKNDLKNINMEIILETVKATCESKKIAIENGILHISADQLVQEYIELVLRLTQDLGLRKK